MSEALTTHEAQPLAAARAQWTTAYINNLPDSAFLHIEAGGSKDSEGKTTPRSLRHFPVKDANGNVDMAHLRNALSRIPQSSLPDSVKAECTAKAQKMMKAAQGGSNSLRAQMGVCPNCGAKMPMDAASCLDCGQEMDGGEMTPMPMRRLLPEIERRTAQLDGVEFRDIDGALWFDGHAAVFGSWSEDLGGFREQIQRGAYRKVLRSNPDVRFLGLNHNPDLPMARTTISEGPGSLVLREDTTGLNVQAQLAPTQAAQDLRTLTKTGVVSQMSFSFGMKGGEDTWDSGYTERTIVEFGSLHDVSPVTFPAYPQTSGSVRSLVAGIEIVDADGTVQGDLLDALAKRIHRGSLAVSLEERWRLDDAFVQQGRLSPWMQELVSRARSLELAGEASTEAEDETPVSPVGQWRLAARKRRLTLMNLNSGVK